jgi:molecular chaperone DnaJ
LNGLLSYTHATPLTHYFYFLLSKDSNINEDTTVQFQELNRAYEVLSDPSLKKMYDMFGESGLGTSAASDIEVGRRRAAAANGSNGAGGFGVTVGRTSPYGSSSTTSMDPEIYDTYFSAKNHVRKGRSAGSGTTTVGSAVGYGSRTGLNQFVGDDVCIDFEVDFKTSILGGEAEVYVRSLETCDVCNGKGRALEDSTSNEDGGAFVCNYCDGTGMTTQVTETPLGKFESNQDCHVCGGTGNAPGSDCLPCEGKGATEKTKAIKVTIPAGVDSGSKLQVCGEGDAGPSGGPSGDLYIFLRIKDDPIFRRDGSDIYAEQTIACLDAMLGNKIRVPIVDGETTIDIPAGTQHGHTICLKGSGAPSLIGNIGQRGDHYVVINVEIPTGESDDEISIVSMLKDQAALLEDPTVAAGASDTVDEVQEQETKKIEVEFSQLEDLRAKAAEAKTERSLRKDFEELAAARKLEIDSLTLRLGDVRTTLREETKSKEEAQEVATQREIKLKAVGRRLDDLKSYLEDT